MRSRILVMLISALSLLALLDNPQSASAGATCFGLAATIVGTDAFAPVTPCCEDIVSVP